MIVITADTVIFLTVFLLSCCVDDYYNSAGADEESIVLNKTRPRPCDKEFYAYEMKPSDSWEPTKGKLPKCHASGCDK